MPERVARFSLLLLPPALLHSNALAEVLIGVIIGALSTNRALHHDWSWLRSPWVMLAGLWWVWLLLCSLPPLAAPETWPAMSIQAFLSLRFLLLAVALENLLAENARTRRLLFLVVGVCAVYFVGQLALQMTTGKNLFGNAVLDNGVLTGPFDRSRAGPELVRMLFPVLLPPAAWLLSRPAMASRIAGGALLALGIAIMVPIGQRMPLLLAGFGLAVSALLLPRLRRPAMLAGLVALATLAAATALFPAAQHRLVFLFAEQMENFPTSHYGLILARTLAMAAAHPWTGRGFGAFRTGASDPRYFAPSLDGTLADGGGAGIYVTHPHNFYLQALVDSGVFGLALFAVLAAVWLGMLARGLRRAPDPLRVGLFIAALLHLWPLATTDDFFSQRIGGWFFLLLGWGLAEARAARRATATPKLGQGPTLA